MLTPGNYKVKESKLIVAEDGTTQLELAVHGYPKPFKALFELIPVQSKEELMESSIRRSCINYLHAKFDIDVATYFTKYVDTEGGGWTQYAATNKATGEVELQREDLFLDADKFADENF